MLKKTIWVINPGSSSLKFGVYSIRQGEPTLELSGSAEGIGQGKGKIELKDAHDQVMRTDSVFFASEGDALMHAVHWVKEVDPVVPCAIGHRVVHGGPHLLNHQLISPVLLEELKNCTHFAPLHLPVAIQLIEVMRRVCPDVPQFACFDTAFHSTLPELSARFALPRELYDEGIRRYGFHGLSYESIVFQMGKDLPGRTVIAHLGSGASLVALKDGRSVDTSMGLTPTGGIPMQTRSGDLDPGVLLYLLRVKKMDSASIEDLLNHHAGLTGISGGDGDMRALLAASEKGDLKAQLAIGVFCISIRKMIAAYAAVLGGLDLLIFTGGIGEQSSRIRTSICDDLSFFKFKNQVVPSQEDIQIARHCNELLSRHER